MFDKQIVVSFDKNLYDMLQIFIFFNTSSMEEIKILMFAVNSISLNKSTSNFTLQLFSVCIFYPTPLMESKKPLERCTSSIFGS